ncbi:NfeD family protein [Erysipelothrix sp. HDW6B]|uniref:NfeD family protein n=1 Tax=Erysipelothrix TaxID=1647 RepID=UPI00135A8522|nr:MULTISPECIES: NfeD family protein [Erysipelothrix]QIK85266.1 NfeD family protein [Erysipelothrix sp. HDW6B]
MTVFWIVVVIAMIVIELLTAGNLVSIWFAIGAIAATAVAFFTDSVLIQVIIFALVSIVSLILIRPFTTRLLRGNVIATNADSLIGRKAILSEAIDEDKWGMIRLNGTEWSATTSDYSELPKGTRVEIIAIEGVKLIVREIKEN